jgi:hypothetical protein
MGTSRLSEHAWTAGVCVFSGRPDPVWPLASADAERLVAVWHALAPLATSPPRPPPLGYRGCVAHDAAGGWRWEAYAGGVRCVDELRSDPTRAFERLVIGSAPLGVLPVNILELAAL